MSQYVFENLERVEKRKLFTLWGVDYVATPKAWFSLLFPHIIGILTSLIVLPNADLGTRFITGIAFGLSFMVAYNLHGIGHIISGKLVGAPMQSMLITSTTQINQYFDAVTYPSWVHIGRTIGGPIANLIALIISLLVYFAGVQHPVVVFFAVINLILTLAILPGPSLDGEVLVREWKDWKPR